MVLDCPQLFPKGAQRVFDYIWENPGCTVKEMEAALYPQMAYPGRNLIAVHLARIRIYLRLTQYRLHSQASTEKLISRGRHPYRYKIIWAKAAQQPSEGITDGTV